MNAHVVGLVDGEDVLSVRYPPALSGEPGAAPIRRGRLPELDSGEVLGAILDGATREEVVGATRSGKPQLLAPAEIALLLESPAPQGAVERWTPYLPAGLSPEVIAAVELAGEGDLGRLHSLHLVTFVGPAICGEWEPDSAFARSRFEAQVFGLDLVARMVGELPERTRWLAEPEDQAYGILAHDVDGVRAVQELRPSVSSAVPLFTATAVFEHGRVLLRHEFAPSGLTVWRAATRSFHALPLAREKPNVQAPDTQRGGLETARLLGGIAGGVHRELPTRAYALEIVQRALSADAGASR